MGERPLGSPTGSPSDAITGHVEASASIGNRPDVPGPARPGTFHGEIRCVVSMTATQADTVESMYDRIGGGPAVRAVVEQLYDWILSDKQLLPYFDGVEIARVKRHMAALLSEVLGGPVPYAGPGLDEAHSRLGVTAEHYARVVDLAVAALLLFHVPRDVVAAVEGVLEQTMSQVVVAPAPGLAPGLAAGDGGAGGPLGDG